MTASEIAMECENQAVELLKLAAILRGQEEPHIPHEITKLIKGKK